MTLLIAILLIKGFNLSAGWYVIASLLWVLHILAYSGKE